MTPFFMGSLNSTQLCVVPFHHPTTFINELSRLEVCCLGIFPPFLV